MDRILPPDHFLFYFSYSKRVVEVETPFGSIKTKHVVNCTGVWANYIADMVSAITMYDFHDSTDTLKF